MVLDYTLTIITKNLHERYDLLGSKKFRLNEIDIFMTNVMFLVRDKPFELDEIELLFQLITLFFDSTRLGLALKAEFGGGIENIYDEMLNAGEITEDEYNTEMAVVDFHCAFWYVIQAGWQYIKLELKNNFIDEYPRTSVAYFFAVLKELYQSRFDAYTKGFSLTTKEAEEYTKLAQENFDIAFRIDLKGNTNRENDITKFQKNKEKLKQYQRQLGRSGTPWFDLAMKVVTDNKHKNARLKQKLNNFYKAGQLTNNLTRLELQRRRKNKQVKAEKWISNKPHEGTKGGWKEVTVGTLPGFGDLEVPFDFVKECFKNAEK